MSKREEILRGVKEAAAVLADSSMSAGGRTSFDIIGAILKREIPLLFRPLDRLWGALVNIGHRQGIMVTSKLGLPVQRFTLAHELGHLLLGHDLSFDDTVGFAGRHVDEGRGAKEVGADTFASELLAPKSLLLRSAQGHGWTKAKLRQPEFIYQLSLRLGISYKATCWALVTSGILLRSEATHLQDTVVKKIKMAGVPHGLIRNAWADVWTLSRADGNTLLEAGPDDLFAVQLADNASAGYIWQLVDADGDAQVVGQRDPTFDDGYGAPSSRTIYVTFKAPGVHHLIFEHRRPWTKSTLERIEVHIDGYGKEGKGWSRRERSDIFAAVA